MKRLGIIFLLLFIMSCSNKNLNMNQNIIVSYYSSYSCSNLNENYLCINTKYKTTNIQKVLYQKQTINPNLYNISSNYTFNNMQELLKKKLKLSEKRLRKPKYTDDGEYIIEESYKEKYRPLYSKKLSQQFNELLLEDINEIEILTSEDKTFMGITKETISRVEKIMLRFFRKNSVIISINNYDDLSVHINKDVYDYIREHHYKEIEKLNITHNFKNPYYQDIAEKNTINIINIFHARKGSILRPSDIKKLDKEISSLLSSTLKGIFKDAAKENKDFEYIFSRGYQFLIDIFSFSKQDSDKFKSLLDLDKLNSQLKIDRKIIYNFYKKHPLKVFVTQTNNYHSPHTDGIYGYLYINKKDVTKLENKKLMKYLLTHELGHITYHFISFQKQFSQFFTLLIDLADNIMNNQTILVKEVDSIINSSIDLLGYYDNEKRFTSELRQLSNRLKKGTRKGIDKVSKSYNKQTLIKGEKSLLKEFFSVENNKKLSFMEEWAIDISNLDKYSFNEKKLYYTMIKTILPKNHTRLKALEKEFILYKKQEESFDKKEFDLVVLLDTSIKFFEKIPPAQKPEGLEEVTEKVLKDMFTNVRQVHTYLKKLDKKSKMYYFINDFYGINIDESEIQLLELLKYIRLKVIMRKTLLNYAKKSLTTGEL
ncbi:MAG TPA: hypothetical protein EYG73_07065 [Arcobacter sp.]|nr:hypothetical protein [Arcobacter sp.]